MVQVGRAYRNEKQAFDSSMPLLPTQHMVRDNGEAHPMLRDACEDPEFGAEEVAAGGEVVGQLERVVLSMAMRYVVEPRRNTAGLSSCAGICEGCLIDWVATGVIAA